MIYQINDKKQTNRHTSQHNVEQFIYVPFNNIIKFYISIIEYAINYNDFKIMR